MRAFGVVLLVLGGIAALFFNWIVGAVLVVIALLMIIAGGQGEKAKPQAICTNCGNPVATTANLCPTCGAKLVPTEGQLSPEPELDEQAAAVRRAIHGK